VIAADDIGVEVGGTNETLYLSVAPMMERMFAVITADVYQSHLHYRMMVDVVAVVALRCGATKRNGHYD
jgi:hypothetical protein